jgi:hypothetical protein
LSNCADSHNHHLKSPHVVMRAHQVRPYIPIVNTEIRPTSEASASSADHADTQQYEIRVKGHLDTRWTAWFDGLNLTSEGDGTTVISGPVVDQAALHGLLQKLRDVGIPLLSLTQLPPDASTVAPLAPRTPKGN